MLLERVALHQTRLKVPGLALDARGVALGTRGLVLFPSIDRLAAFLASYGREQSLEPIVPSCRIEILRSSLGLREMTFSFDAESTERLDRVAEIARLVGGLSFTGSGRTYVQYRDARAPFGYDAPELLPSDADFLLYHSSFSQSYELEKSLDLRRVLLWLEPRPEARPRAVTAPLWLLVEPGLGPPLLSHLAAIRADAFAVLLEDERWLFELVELSARARAVLDGVPGITAFGPAAPGALIEIGFEHPVPLHACPVFESAGLVLFRGRREPPLCIERLPARGHVRDLVRVGVPDAVPGEPPRALATATAPALRLTVSVVPGGAAGAITAAWIAPDELELLRRLAYAFPARLLENTTVAVTEQGAFVRNGDGLPGLPLGRGYSEVHPGLLLPAGSVLKPAIAPALVFEALGSPPDRLVFLRPDAAPIGVERAAFVPLGHALAHAERWAPANGAALPALARELATVWLEPLGLLPLRKAT